MSVAFLTRAPTLHETERLRLALSTFCDGSGMVCLDSGATLPGWRDAERLVAELLAGAALENKGVFDVIVSSTQHPDTDYGLSIKCKEQPQAVLRPADGRAYLELANSPAKFWKQLGLLGITETDFRARSNAQTMGDSILSTVQSWHAAAASQHKLATRRTLDLASSAYLSLSCTSDIGPNREYQWHSFPLSFPSPITWTYNSDKCLRGFDRLNPTEPLFDWYGLSGGQLKYYPRVSSARYKSVRFRLESTPGGARSLGDKAARYWPAKWLAAGGTAGFDSARIAQELRTLEHTAADHRAKHILSAAATALDGL